MKIMAIGAHPADIFDLAGGTLRLHSIAGDEIVGVTLTDGIWGHWSGKKISEKIYEKKVRRIKWKEFSNAGFYISDISSKGIYESLGYEDEPLTSDWLKIEKLVTKIRDYKPDLLITHHPNEYAHWDHAVCGQMVCRALKSAIKLPGDKHWVKTVYFFGVQFRPETARLGIVPQPPDVLIDISDVVEDKVRMMTCFRSQGLDDEKKMWQRMESFEGEAGRADGIRYAEAFTLLYPLKGKRLPVNETGGFYR